MGPSGIKEKGFTDIKIDRRISDLIEFIDNKTDGHFKKVIFNNRGNLHPYVNIIVNGRKVANINENLNDGDDISFMVIRPLAGG
jgi:hypothetical protein